MYFGFEMLYLIAFGLYGAALLSSLIFPARTAAIPEIEPFRAATRRDQTADLIHR